MQMQSELWTKPVAHNWIIQPVLAEGRYLYLDYERSLVGCFLELALKLPNTTMGKNVVAGLEVFRCSAYSVKDSGVCEQGLNFVTIRSPNPCKRRPTQRMDITVE